MKDFLFLILPTKHFLIYSHDGVIIANVRVWGIVCHVFDGPFQWLNYDHILSVLLLNLPSQHTHEAEHKDQRIGTCLSQFLHL